MKIFLKVDLGIQILLFLILLFGVAGFMVQHESGTGILLFFVFMGLWQPLSSFIHLAIKPEKNRAFYLISAIAYVCLMPVIVEWNILVPFYFFGAFCFSVWYFQISYAHLKRLENASSSFWDLA